MAKSNHGDDLINWIICHVFTAGVLSFTMDLFKAFLLGIVGAIGGLLAKWFYTKYLKS